MRIFIIANLQAGKSSIICHPEMCSMSLTPKDLNFEEGENNGGTLGIVYYVFSHRGIYIWWRLCNAPDHTKRDCREKRMVYK